MTVSRGFSSPMTWPDSSILISEHNNTVDSRPIFFIKSLFRIKYFDVDKNSVDAFIVYSNVLIGSKISKVINA